MVLKSLAEILFFAFLQVGVFASACSHQKGYWRTEEP